MSPTRGEVPVVDQEVSASTPPGIGREETIRVMVIDSLPILRNGLCHILQRQPEFEVIDGGKGADEAVFRLRDTPVHVAVMECTFCGVGGIAGIGMVAAQPSAPRIVVVTDLGPDDHLMPALEAGARGFLPRGASVDHLIDAVKTVARGGTYLTPESTDLLLERYLRALPPHTEVLHRLGLRDREILTLTAGGYSSRDIGGFLAMTPGAVDTARLRAMERAGLHQRSEVVRFVLQAGLLSRS